MVGSFSHNFIKTSTRFLQITLHSWFVLFGLGFHLVQPIDLFSKLSHVVVMLLSKSCKSALMRNVGFLKLTLQLCKLRFPFLVQFDLGCGIIACIFKSLAKIFNVSRQQRSILFCLGPVLTPNCKFFVDLFKAALKLLDLTTILASKSLLVFNLSCHRGKLLFFSLNCLT